VYARGVAGRYSLDGKAVLITGAARGIGAEAARQLARRGARVSCVGLEPEELERVARDCGNGALWFEADVADRASVERAVAATVEATGGIDVVIPNAGIAPHAAFRHMPPEAFERVVDVNLLGVYRTIHACLPHVLERRGYVLPVSSLSALLPSFPGFTAYAATKAGIEAMALALRAELKHLGVDVGVAYFSWIGTELVTGADATPAFSLLRSRLKGPLAKTYPVSDAGRAIVRGVERRSAVVAAPSWVRLVRLMRGVLLPAAEPQVHASAPEAMALFEAEYQRLGAAAAQPVGAGGAADVRAAQRSGLP
jgi:NAD(P)-dependent dehydrogenase (short-subunit alcohol dehydrogenase family)